MASTFRYLHVFASLRPKIPFQVHATFFVDWGGGIRGGGTSRKRLGAAPSAAPVGPGGRRPPLPPPFPREFPSLLYSSCLLFISCHPFVICQYFLTVPPALLPPISARPCPSVGTASLH